MYQVAFVNWRGEWTMDERRYDTPESAAKRARALAKTKAENGRVSVRRMRW